MRQFPAELYSEFFLDMIDVYDKYRNNKLVINPEDEPHFINSLFLFGGIHISKTEQAFIQPVQTERQIQWQ